MAERMLCIEFESVSAIRYPLFYDPRTERVRQGLDWSIVPEDAWTKAERTSTESDIRSQYTGLMRLINEGELIRNVKVYEVKTEKTEIEVNW